MDNDDLLLVGVIARPHGIRGSVIVNPETDFADERFKAGHDVRIGPAGAARPARILDVRGHQGRVILDLEGIETMTDAEALAGLEVWMPASALGPLPERTYYRHDLVGCEVRDAGGTTVGRVTRVEGTIDRSYLIVPRRGGEMMIPMVEGILVQVDLEARRIVVNPPEGLFDL